MKNQWLLQYSAFHHVNGLPIPENTLCEIMSYEDRIDSKSGTTDIKLPRKKITDMCLKTDTEIQNQVVSSVGGANVRGFGDCDRWQGKTKEVKITTQYLIITYANCSIPQHCKSIVWRCCSRIETAGHVCHSQTVNDTLLEQVVIDAINRVLCQKDGFPQTLRANIATVVLQGDTISPEVIDERLNKLQKELLKKVNQKDNYDAIADEILRLRDQRRQAEVDSVIKDEHETNPGPAGFRQEPVRHHHRV